MRWYLVTMLFLAFLVGSLFQATEQTGMRVWNMFATMGIFLFGAVGSVALTQMQRRSGLSSVEKALKALEPEWLITDWSSNPGERPDYLLVGPQGIVAVVIDQMAGSTFAWIARRAVSRGRDRANRAAGWVASQLATNSPEGTQGLQVQPLLLLSRRRALPEYSADGVLVLNPEQIAEALQSVGQGALLESTQRVKLTRQVREHSLPPSA